MQASAVPPLTSPPRHDTLDAFRGLAIVWMTGFHFCFDLNAFGYIRQNFLGDPFWTSQRTAIVSLFLFCAGLGQAVAHQQAQGWQRFWRRWGQVAGCALLVTAGSYLMFPRSFIYFGVLHGMAVMLLVCRATASWGRWLWPAGLVVVLLGVYVREVQALLPFAGVWDHKALNWLGLISHKPDRKSVV